MRSVILAVGSFVVGTVSTLLIFSGHQTSMMVHQVSAQGRSGEISAAIPLVPPLTDVLENSEFDGVVQLDGMNCTRCIFRNVTLEYSGGAYRLVDAMFIGRIGLTLRGAAINTLAALLFFNATAPGIPQSPPRPPIFRDFEDRPLPMTLISPTIIDK